MRQITIAVVLALALSGPLAVSASAATDSATYTYDALGRVTQVTYANGTTIVYHYDAAGNRSSVVVTCGGSGC